MESHQATSLFPSLQQLLRKLERLIASESSRKDNPWIGVAELNELFREKYDASLEEAVRMQGYGGGLRKLISSSRRFSIYSTSTRQEFYVALSRDVMPAHVPQPLNSSAKQRIKRPRKVRKGFIKILKSRDAG
jgi:hypothetical protein